MLLWGLGVNVVCVDIVVIVVVWAVGVHCGVITSFVGWVWL